MAKQPAVVAIVRHGTRLDASDRTWRDSAEKPYDTPLSYGGWRQCQMLGARIANELKLLDATEKVEGHERPHGKRKVVIHCSPYLRCIQTAIAVAAGLEETDPRPPRLPPALRDGSQLQGQIKEEDESEDRVTVPVKRPLLRLDCFLEEWRSAGYFEKSLPPAPSQELLSTAKNYLQQRAEEIKGADLASPPIDELAAIDWNEKASEASSIMIHEKTGLRQQISKRARHLSDIPSNGRPFRFQQLHGYNAPIPTYAIAPSDAIPVGFVAHARDACIEVDYDWDSTKEWGDGGIWDEEWGSMHRRVGNGLEELLQYYTEEQEDTVIVLVTHQACCNALIRRMTGAPALHDIGTASLTLAVRRKTSSESAVKSLAGRIQQEYEMKIIASTEHLRGGSNPLGLNSPRLGRSPAFTGRRIVGADSPEGFTLGDPWRPHPMSRSLSHRSSEADAEPPIPEGLWGSGKGISTGTAVEDGPDKLWGDGEPKLPIRSVSQRGGMWGGSIARDRSPAKRRWTAVDRSP